MANTPKDKKEPLPHVLIVEGKDEEHVIYQVRDYYNIPVTFDVIDAKGNDNACEQFVSELAASNYKRVGLLVDNEPDRNIWESITSDFAGYKVFGA